MPFDAFLKIDNVKGESADAKHKGEIDILNFRWSLTNAVTIGSATGGAGAGKVKFNEFKIIKQTDAATPALFKACASGQHFQTVTLVTRKAGGKQLEYLTIKFSTVFVVSIKSRGPRSPLLSAADTLQDATQSDDQLPTEEITFVYGTLQVQYQPQGPDGGAQGGPVLAGWDQVLNKKA
jgi:type VI secretion system secreted protein Hcp